MGTRFQIPPGAFLRIASISGHVSVIAEERADLEIDPPERRIELEDGGRTVHIQARSTSLIIRCPQGSDVAVGSVSGHIELEGRFGSVKATTVSGHIQIDSASGDVDVRSVSGHLSVDACGGRCQLNTKSGKITVGRVEKAVRASTLSGRVELGTAGREDVEIRTISGGITVRIAGAKHPHPRLRSLSGHIRCDCLQGSDFEIKATTISGSIDIAGT